MAFIGAAPLTLVRTTAGPAAYVYAGQPAPAGIDEQLDRLVAEGYLVEVDDVVLEEPDVVVPDDPGDGSAGPGITVERPKRTATKDLWLEFRGVPAEQASAFTVEQLQDDEYMDDWAARSVDPSA